MNFTFSDNNGYYKLKVPSEHTITLFFSFLQKREKKTVQKLKKGETFVLNIKIDISKDIQEITKYGEKDRNQISTINIEGKKLERFPSVTGTIESFLKFFGAASNNELSSGYNVRGGNYDENLVYINNIEVYRPFIIRAGQQEGLSVINPEMVDRVSFSSGGFEAKYGDKLSSVLDIQYKTPRKYETTVKASFMGTDITIGNQSKNRRLSFIIGARYRSNRLLFNSLDISGDYRPLNADLQSFIRYRFSKSWSISLLSNLAYNKFSLVPSDRQTSFGTVNTALKLNINMGGLEQLKYFIALNGLTFQYKSNNNTDFKIIASHYTTNENEQNTTEGAYGLYELDNNLGSENIGKEKRMLGVGYFINNARNELKADVYNGCFILNKQKNKSNWTIGSKYQNEKIDDKINEWKYNDSAGHNISLNRKNGENIILDERIKATNSVSSFRISSFIQNNILIKQNINFRVNAGIRHQFWSFNNENIISPRFNISIEPNKKFNDTLLKKLKNINQFDSLKKRDYMLKFSCGIYYQSPFYREMRKLDGSINEDIKSQQSTHFVFGYDLNFKAWERPFKLVSEIYYKNMKNLIPYYIDNVRIRYYGENTSQAYSTGIDTRINGEFISGLESWLNFSLLQTQENITYISKDGLKKQSGYIRRPTDQRVNFSILFADELNIDKTYKMHLGLVFGSRLPYYFNGENRYTSLPNTIPPYRRVDIGFSKEIIGGFAKPSEKWNRIETLWLSFEIFNLLQFNNTVSYIWVKDINNLTYGVPNYLTGRRINLRMILKLK